MKGDVSIGDIFKKNVNQRGLGSHRPHGTRAGLKLPFVSWYRCAVSSIFTAMGAIPVSMQSAPFDTVRYDLAIFMFIIICTLIILDL